MGHRGGRRNHIVGREFALADLQPRSVYRQSQRAGAAALRFRAGGVSLELQPPRFLCRDANLESLRWQTFNPGPFTDKANELARLLFDFVQEEFRSSSSRRDSFAVTRIWKWRVHDWFKQVFQDEPDFAALFGLRSEEHTS